MDGLTHFSAPRLLRACLECHQKFHPCDQDRPNDHELIFQLRSKSCCVIFLSFPM